MNREILRGAVLGAMLAIGFGGAAHAETVAIKYAGPASVATSNWQLPVKASPDNYLLGSYTIQEQGGPSFLAYCTDPDQYADGSFHPYQKASLTTHLAATPTLQTDIEKLFGHAYQATQGDALKSASFAVALWEVWRDDGVLATGDVRTTGSSNALVIAGAQSLLDALPTWTATGTAYRLTVYSNYTDATHYQDFIAASIPEPESYALMLAGLGLLGIAARRRRMR